MLWYLYKLIQLIGLSLPHSTYNSLFYSVGDVLTRRVNSQSLIKSGKALMCQAIGDKLGNLPDCNGQKAVSDKEWANSALTP